MKELQEINIFLSKWVDPKTVFQLYNDSKNNPLGPQKVKNNPKIKSKEKVRIEGTIEKKVVQLHEWTPYLIPGTIPRPQICLLGQQKVKNNLKLSQNQNSELKET